VFFRAALVSTLFISATGFAVTEADLLNAENVFAGHVKNVQFVQSHLNKVAADTGMPIPTDDVGGNPSNPSPWYGEPEAWTDLVVAMRTLQTVTSRVEASMPSLKFVLFNFPVFTVRHTALCTQLNQIVTAWTALEFADSTTLFPVHRLGPIFYQDARAVIDISRGPAGLQCP
jgi:hypothetical protein